MGTSESIGCGAQRVFCPNLSVWKQNPSLTALAMESELPLRLPRAFPAVFHPTHGAAADMGGGRGFASLCIIITQGVSRVNANALKTSGCLRRTDRRPRRHIFGGIVCAGRHPRPAQEALPAAGRPVRAEARKGGIMSLRTDAARHPSFFLDGTARKWYNDNGIAREPLNQSAAALRGPFAPAYRLEIRKGFLRFPNLNLEQNPSEHASSNQNI